MQNFGYDKAVFGSKYRVFASKNDYNHQLLSLSVRFCPKYALTPITAELINKNVYLSKSTRFLTRPELPDIKDFYDVDGLRKRIKALKNAEEIGAEVIIETLKGKAKEEIWVRNFEGPYSYPHSIAIDLAELMACYSAAKINQINIDHLLDEEK